MFGANLYELKEQKLETKKKELEKQEEKKKELEKQEEEKRKLESAKQRLEIIKDDLEKLANKGETLKVEFSGDRINHIDDIAIYFDKLRELGWEEGINIYTNPNFEPELYSASIEDLFQNKSIYDYIYANQNPYLNNKEKMYIDKERKYFNQLLDGSPIFDLYASCMNLESKNIGISTRALANAAYRIGMEGSVTFGVNVLEIKPTYRKILSDDIINDEGYENYIEIMHRYYKEKREQDSQVSKQKAKNSIEG